MDLTFFDNLQMKILLSAFWYRFNLIPNDEDGMPNSVDPDQTAPLREVRTGSALFAKT